MWPNKDFYQTGYDQLLDLVPFFGEQEKIVKEEEKNKSTNLGRSLYTLNPVQTSDIIVSS